MAYTNEHEDLTLVTGGTGKTGRRIAARLHHQGRKVRIGSRQGAPAFDWQREKTWDAALSGVRNVYISFAPDLAIPRATETIAAFCHRARLAGVRRLVLLSGRGEPEAQACERLVQASGLEWTVVRASWFNQNFSEGAFVEMVRSGVLALPAGLTPEPFVDVDDIADVAAAALVDDGHLGEIYEVTGPRLMTMADIADDIGRATGRRIEYVDIAHADFIAELRASDAPWQVVWLLDYLFSTVLDGRNAKLADGIERALGRAPTDFADFARRTAASGVWDNAQSMPEVLAPAGPAAATTGTS